MQGGKYENKWEQDWGDKRVWSVHTEPKVDLVYPWTGQVDVVLIKEVWNRPESNPDSNGQGQCAVGSDRFPG